MKQNYCLSEQKFEEQCVAKVIASNISIIRKCLISLILQSNKWKSLNPYFPMLYSKLDFFNSSYIGPSVSKGHCLLRERANVLCKLTLLEIGAFWFYADKVNK